MIESKRILAIIPARGGSKGVIRKNIREIAGKPLLAWTIEAAQKSQYIDFIMLSSEDDEIIEEAKKWGCEVPFKRPICLAQDSTPSIEPVLYTLSRLVDYDYVVLLQPTSPLRSHIDIDACIEKCFLEKVDSCVSVSECEESPFWMYTLTTNGVMKPFLKQENLFTQRQQLPQAYSLNGAVYVSEKETLIKNKSFITTNTLAYIMPKDRALDIDTELDLKIADLLMKDIILKNKVT